MRQVQFLQNLIFQVTCYLGILCPLGKVHTLEYRLLKKVFGPKNNAMRIWGIT